MDSTTARQRRGTAKPSMKKNARGSFSHWPQGAQLAREPPPRAALLHLPPQIASSVVRFRGGPTFASF